MKTKFLAASLIAFGSLAGGASAAILNLPVPGNAYVANGGLDWAWASPLPASSGYLDLSYQSTLGWRIPTLAELNSFAPAATDFLSSSGNVPFAGSDPISGATFSATNSAYTSASSAGIVAVPYFSNSYSHADWQDGLGQPLGPWAGMAGSSSYSDQLVVRTSVPEPSSALLLGLGALGFAARRRRRK